MQAVFHRVHGFLDPFQCQFALPEPVHPTCRARKPPPDLPLELWLDIFQFSTYVHRSATLKPLDPFTARKASTNVMAPNTPALALQTKLALVNVCKSWRRLALPILYQHVVIRSPLRAGQILRTLEESRTPVPSDSSQGAKLPGYGQWTRHIEVFTHSRGCSNLSYLQSLFSVFRCCPNLRTLSGTWSHPLPPQFLDAVSTIYGPVLEELCWNEASDKLNRNLWRFTTSATIDFLTSFSSLRILDLRHFKAKDPLPDFRDTERPILPFVQDLILSTHSWSLATASHIAMPRLRSLTVRAGTPEYSGTTQLTQFIKVHGPSLQYIDLPLPSMDDDMEPGSSLALRNVKQINPEVFLGPDACPNLLSIVFPATSPPSADHSHPNLRCIGLRGVKADCMYPDKGGLTKDFLYSVTSDRYPRLEMIQTIGFLVEADGDHLIKDIFIWWVERLEKEGIDFLDGEGVLWAYTDAEEIAPPVESRGRPAMGPEEDSTSEACGEGREKNEDLKPSEEMLPL